MRAVYEIAKYIGIFCAACEAGWRCGRWGQASAKWYRLG